jgi:N-acylglucosamine-6-phosphate 2-epimerase
MSNLLKNLEGKLIVSCQAPPDSPLYDPSIISAIALAAAKRGAVGVRIDTPDHVKAVREKMPELPIIGLWKRQIKGYEVYITPQYGDAVAIAAAGADIIAIDATGRQRPEGENLKEIIAKIRGDLGKLVMADIDTAENAIAAVEAGADIIGTTLYGYTGETKHLSPPSYSLLTELAAKLTTPLICEGGINTPQEAKKALELGAYAVVVGTAITGIDLKVKAFVEQLS